MQILKYRNGFIVTEIKQLPEERILHVVWLGGRRFAEWVEEAYADLKSLGAKHGCSSIEAHCRPGLARMLKAHGFRTVKKTIRADL